MSWKNTRRLLGLLILVGLPTLPLPRLMNHSPAPGAPEAPGIVHADGDKKVFVSPLAGTWYDADKTKLTAELDGYLAKADPALLEKVQALVLPHAGYRYSGGVAAFGVKEITGKKYARVIVMGPSHRVPMEGIAHVSDVTVYATPLGEVPLDTAAIAELRKHPEFRTVRGVDEAEHSVQIEVPLLQRALGDFKLVPIVVGDIDQAATEKMAKILLGIVDPETLVVASSDFTHYGAGYAYVPFEENIQENLKKLDMGAWDEIEKKDAAGFSQYVDKTGATICGRRPIALLLSMLPQASQAHLLKYDTSGRMTDDTKTSVSYFSLAFTGTWPKADPVPAEKTVQAATLTAQDKTQLLTLARGMLETYVKSGKTARPEDFGVSISPGMSQTMGAFVTLTIDGELRGCIGEIFPRRPLYKAVMEHAIDAAVNDRRFQPVTEADLPKLHYEISALTRPTPVGSYKDIVLGKHGMVIEKDGRTAVFLPQVAPEQHWTLDETLTHLSVKAGLPPDAWKAGASWTVFEAIVFNEQK